MRISGGARGVGLRRGAVLATALASSAAGLAVVAAPASAAATTWFVAQGGSDSNDCSSAAKACATITRALAVAASGDTIEVSGTISDHVSVPAGKKISIVGAVAAGGNSTVVDGGNKPGVPVFTIGAATVTLTGLTIEHGAAGGIVNQGGTLTLTRGTVTANGNAGGQGGGIRNVGGNVVLNATTVSHNMAADGGGIANTGGTASVIVRRSSLITGNIAGDGGGGIFTDSAGPGEAFVTGSSTVSGNTAGGDGGGILAVGADAALGDKSVVAGNTAQNGGGVAIRAGASGTGFLSLDGFESVIRGNVARGAGGGVFNQDDGSVVLVQSSSISGNTATTGGGVANEAAGTIKLVSSGITGNSASGAGGGVLNVAGRVQARLTAQFDGNTAGADGGAIDSLGGTLALQAITVRRNTAGGDGGAIRTTNTTGTLSGTPFTDNTAGGDGGAILNVRGGKTSALTVTASAFIGDSATTGGAVENSGGTVRVGDTTFTGDGSRAGGAVDNVSGTMALVDDTIAGNTAPARGGGGIRNSGRVAIGASIVAGNVGGDCAAGAGTRRLTSAGYNLTEQAGSGTCGFRARTDVLRANPRLGSLGRHVSLTDNMVPAKNGRAAAVIPIPTVLTVAGKKVAVCGHGILDQRGFRRPEPFSVACTIGATEVPVLRLRVGRPTITGTARVGARLVAHAGNWTPGTTFAYQWLRNGVAIKGATRATFRPGPALAGHLIRVRVTGRLRLEVTPTRIRVKQASRTSAARVVARR